MADRRFPTSFKDVPDPDEPGLVLGDDNVVYLIKPDGSRVEVGSQTYLVATAILDNEAIKALPNSYYELIPPTEILNYSTEPSELPVPVMATAWLVKQAPNNYGNAGPNGSLVMFYGSDFSTLLGQVLEIVQISGTDPGGDYRFVNPAGSAFANVEGSRPLLFAVSPQYPAGANLQDNGVYLTFQDPDFGGADLTGGADTNTLKIEIVYRVIGRS